jgi:hypothetical protein
MKELEKRKELLAYAMKGRGFPSMEFADEMEKKGLAEFTGDQWTENWEWKTERLMQMPEEDLLALHNRMHKSFEEIMRK